MENPFNLFDSMIPDDVPEWEHCDMEHWEIARVVFPDGPEGCFDYRIPDHLIDSVEPGMRLLVPLGKSNRQLVVYAVEVLRCEKTASSEQNVSSPIDSQSSRCHPARLKEILQVIDPICLLSPKMLELAKWLALRYLSPLGQVLEAVLPAGVREHAGTRLTTVYSLAEEVLMKLENQTNHQQKGGRGDVGVGGEGSKTGGEATNSLTAKQRVVLHVLQQAPQPMTLTELARAAKCSMVPINALKKLGLFQKSVVRRQSLLFEELSKTVARTEPFILNHEQQVALDHILTAIRRQEFSPFLLHGITGSGKTEVYIQAIEEVVSYGKQAIVLVPEISLTPQTVNRFRQRFNSIAVLHSHLTDAERHVEWSRISSGQIQVVIGARSAIFAPVPRCGLIVIDEEHESSFKQDAAPRYHAREVALFRARQEKIPVILGSATPSLESWQRQKTGEFKLLSIQHRVRDLPLPPVHLVDLRTRSAYGFTRGAIHQQMQLAIQEVIESKGQVILLLNRRGFSTQIQCPSCGDVFSCPDCDVSLTHHHTEQIALCHYCDYQIPVPNNCPKCGFKGIRFSGFGTQKLEQELAARFPGVTTLRMDADTMQGHGSHERALDAFREGRFQILLGTQMIAKGLDFPNVTLVGVINADTALHFPDFRASERTFYLITQVAGRTGRGNRKGKVIVQTYNPDHPAIIAASRHDYLAFVEQELADRCLHGYPPFTHMVRLIVRGPVERDVVEFIKGLGEHLRTLLAAAISTTTSHENNSVTNIIKQGSLEKKGTTFQFRLLGPAPCPFTRLRGNYRYHLHLHGNDFQVIQKAMIQLKRMNLKVPPHVQWVIDVDPLDML